MLDEAAALEKLTQGAVQLPPLQLRLTATEAWAGGRRLDWTVEMSWKDTRVQFAVEYIRVSTPKNFQAALDRLRAFGSAPGRPENAGMATPGPSEEDGTASPCTSEERGMATPGAPGGDGAAPLLPMLMAPYLDPGELDQLVQEEISGIDFCGNGAVIVPGKWLIYRTGKPNEYPSSAPIKKVYQGKSSFVGRLLVLRDGFSQVSELWKEIERRGGKISLGTVSKVLKVLEQELIVSREDGVAVIQPDLLLDRLAASYAAPSDLVRTRGRLPERADMLQELNRLAVEEGVRFAAGGASRYARVLTSDQYPPIYVESADRIMELSEFQQTERFANVELRETRDPVVYFDTRLEEDVTWTSPVQTYIELAQGGTRDSEFAADLRERILGGQFD
jgi:hypothetical protein